MLSSCLKNSGELELTSEGRGIRNGLPRFGGEHAKTPASVMAASSIEPAGQDGEPAEASGRRQRSAQPPEKSPGQQLSTSTGDLRGSGAVESQMPLSAETAVASEAITTPLQKSLDGIPAAASKGLGVPDAGTDPQNREVSVSVSASEPAGPRKATAASSAATQQHEASQAAVQQLGNGQSLSPAGAGLTKEAAIERLEGLLRRLSAEHDPEGFFRERVSTELKGCENYYDRIRSPMWLSLVSSKVHSPHVSRSDH